MSDGTELPEESPAVDLTRRFSDLRSVQWRIDLGVLPSSPSACTDELRRVTADSRRRYASLRRRLLIDPHTSKDGTNLPDLAMDNPLSQNPESSWGRFFRNAELEKMVDQDLLRLYPEDGSYFQTPGCQGMLRRILLLWCLRHPNCGYRQGMHELLAPLIYVLQVDINRLSEVRDLYEEHFTDKFDELSVHESDLTYNFDYQRFSNSMESPRGSKTKGKATSLSDLDPDVQKIVLLSDPYGAEGELGIVLSEKFMEHDAYSMFEALLSGSNGLVAMADFFSHLPSDGTSNSSPPVIEASTAIYHLLSVVDSPLHAHLTELGVEPQYFSLRWLRVLFGREFTLPDLLVVWDEIFSQSNRKIESTGLDSGFGIFGSGRGAFIAGMAVSMILYLRPSLLGAEIATSALKRLLNFPHDIDLKKIIEKAKSLQLLALDDKSKLFTANPMAGLFDQRKPIEKGHSLSSESVSPKSPLSLVPDSYWEERWRVLNKGGEDGKRVSIPSRKKGWTEKVRGSLVRTESDPSHVKAKNLGQVPRTNVRRSLLEDLSKHLGSDEVVDDIVPEDKLSSDEHCSVSSDPSSPVNETVDTEHCSAGDSPPLPISDVPECSTPLTGSDDNCVDIKEETDVKEQKPIFNKFQWLWKFGRGQASEEKADKGEEAIEAPKSSDSEGDQKNIETESSTSDEKPEPCASSKGEASDHKVIHTFKNLGQTMLEHIQVIESAFQPDRGQVGTLESFSKNVLVGKGQVTAMAALKELRKISNLLSEM